MYRPYILLSFLLLLFTIQASMAQDTIRRTDGVLISAQVLEEQNNIILFKKTADTLARTYRISMDEVEWIRYGNGTIKQYTKPATNIAPAKEPTRIRNIILLRPADFVFSAISLAYERVTPSQKFSYRIPLAFSLRNPPTNINVYDQLFYPACKSFSTGLELNFYVGSPNEFRYYIGPAVHLGYFRFSIPAYYPYSTQAIHSGKQIAFLLNNGFWYQIGKTILIGADGGIGFRKRSYSVDGYYSLAGPKLTGNINIGFQF